MTPAGWVTGWVTQTVKKLRRKQNGDEQQLNSKNNYVNRIHGTLTLLKDTALAHQNGRAFGHTPRQVSMKIPGAATGLTLSVNQQFQN